MKKLLIISATVSSLVFFGSCSKDLDQKPISTITTENFFANKNDFIQAGNAVYSIALRGTASNSYGYPDRLLNLSETRSDNLYAITDGARDWEGINGFWTTISGNTYVSEAYTNNYSAISKANVFLQKLTDGGVGIIGDTALATRMEAETKFLRAFCYFDLIRWFGKVPLVDKPISAEEAESIPRSPVADIYNFIVADLNFAVEKLPAVYTAAGDKGRVTSIAAKTLLALTYMTKSSPTYGIEGPGLNSNEWDKAYTLLTDVLANTNYGFETNYKDIYSYANENKKEVIFDVQYMSGQTPVLGASFVWILTPDGYFQSLGLSAQGSNYQRPISEDFLAKFDTADLRRKFSIQDGYTYQTTTATYSFYKKWIDKSKYGSSRTDWPINFIVFSYTDALLLKAECTLHGGGGTQTDVDDAVTKVRVRAGKDPMSNVTLDQLMEERRREFCGEGKRWHDLVRSGSIETIINNWIQADDKAGRINTFTPDFIIYPIPRSELTAKPGLYQQNHGYDD